MEETLKFILEKITNNPDKISLEKVEEDKMITFNITLADEDKGLVIGKQGRTIKAIRDVLGVMAARDGVKVFLKIQD